MAIHNLSRMDNNNKKRESAFAVYRVDLSERTYATGDVLQVGVLPAAALVLSSAYSVSVATIAGASVAANIVAATGTRSLGGGKALSLLSTQTLTTAIPPLGAEAVVELTLSFTGAVPVVGVFEVFVEFIEPNLASGSLSNYVE